MFCKYKDIFGAPNEGIHSYRIFNIAIVDLSFTVIAAFIINYYLPDYNTFIIFVFLFILGIIMHRLFCVHTTIDNILFS